MNKLTSETVAQELAEEHWNYVENLLKAHKISKAEIGTIGFHYKTAFVHGFKHGVEWRAKEG